MVKEEFYYDSRDGKSKLHAVRYVPDNPEDIRCVVQIVHGMAEYIERYEEFAGFLTDRGCVVTGEDHMGHGKSVGKTEKYGYFCEQDPATVLVRDVHRLKKATQALYPDVPYVILGHSMGSFITRNYMFRYGTGISAAIIMGTGMQSPVLLKAAKALAHIQKAFYGPKHVSGLIDKLSFGSYNKRIENPATSADWLSRDGERVAKYTADPMCGFVFTANGFLTLFELISRVNRRENLERVPAKLPVLVISGDADPVGEYGKGVQKAYESLKAVGVENISLKLYEGGRHELLNETNRDEVMQDVFRWIEETVLTGSGAEQQE
ncbi:MAG: lysophospholipase [Butyrivibrio sp.]|nr:lysophospholipase [Acetatifactor muris]MCM1560388.1 lysophospholipase [Butyrivibrio sp.]